MQELDPLLSGYTLAGVEDCVLDFLYVEDREREVGDAGPEGVPTMRSQVLYIHRTYPCMRT